MGEVFFRMTLFSFDLPPQIPSPVEKTMLTDICGYYTKAHDSDIECMTYVKKSTYN